MSHMDKLIISHSGNVIKATSAKLQPTDVPFFSIQWFLTMQLQRTMDGRKRLPLTNDEADVEAPGEPVVPMPARRRQAATR